MTGTCSHDAMNHMLFHNSGLHLLKHSIYYIVFGILSVNKDLNMFLLLFALLFQKNDLDIRIHCRLLCGGSQHFDWNVVLF